MRTALEQGEHAERRTVGNDGEHLPAQPFDLGLKGLHDLAVDRARTLHQQGIGFGGDPRTRHHRCHQDALGRLRKRIKLVRHVWLQRSGSCQSARSLGFYG